MRRTLLASLLLVLASTTTRAGETRDISKTVAIEPGQSVEIEFSIGELRIDTDDGDEIVADVTVRCKKSSSKCRKALEKATIVSRNEGDRTVLEVVGRTKMKRRKLEVEGTIIVPRSAPLEVDMGIGELDIEGVHADLTVDMGIGDVYVQVAEQQVRSVYLDAGIGDATLRPSASAQSSRPALVGAEVYWDEGTGGSKVIVDLGIGDITVDLD